MDYSKITLGELLSSHDEIIKRNAVSILKRYQKENITIEKENIPTVEMIGENEDWDTGEKATMYRVETPNGHRFTVSDYTDGTHIDNE